MNALTLQWYDAGQQKTQKIYENSPSKNSGTVRIGRDPLRCDIVLSHPTVSGLHIEIYFQLQQQCFVVKNLRESNPPLINGRLLIQGEMALPEGSIICLGQQELKVIAVSITTASSVPPTILSTPKPLVPNPQPASPTPPRQPQIHQGHHPNPPIPPIQQRFYGLQCPKCHKVSSPEHLQVGCPWCGTSLAAAISVLAPPN
ncbi:MAG: FHA domain-containing protein [Scytonema sp. PMC 1069.18]|nr:FHA domain-containing protein [Scytonema sp. PMC 1069.18]MEC4885006.1 FHA domain-containing protein [Scytonema sp. PMC 1070.18]